MQLGPEGKLAVVTGLAVTTALAAEGAHVIGGARDTSDELSALAETGSVESVVVDLSTPAGPVDLAAGGTDPRPDRHPDQQRRRGTPLRRRLLEHHR